MSKLWVRTTFLLPLLLAVRAGLHDVPKMVDDQPSMAKNRGMSHASSGYEPARSGACTEAYTERVCLRRSGCAWCMVKHNEDADGDGVRAVSSIRRKSKSTSLRGKRGQQLECGKWSACVGPPGLCELRRDRKSCEKDSEVDVPCAWCASEDRCVTYTSNASGHLVAQCVGCDGKFNSGMKTDVCGVCGGTNSTCFAFTRQEQIGILLALSGNILISPYIRLKLWWVGMVLMAMGETGNFLAYAYAPATVVAPLGAVSVISNSILAHYILREHIGPRNLFGVAMAILGSVLIVLYAPSSDKQLTMEVLIEYMSDSGFAFFVISISIAILILFLLPDNIKKRYVVIYTLICSLTGSLTVMCVKGVSTALVLTLQGNNQFYNVLPWILVAVTVGTLIVQLKYLNLAMMHFGASEVVPVYYVLFTFCSIMAGIVLYKEYHQHCPPTNPDCHYTLFFVSGCLVTFSGVYLITFAKRSKTNYRDELDDLADEMLDGRFLHRDAGGRSRSDWTAYGRGRAATVEVETEGLLGGTVMRVKNSPPSSPDAQGVELSSVAAQLR
ncbi:hypothetical protein GUITHDRAFT_160735 [Guillardia theta CCMP2712]|uniref:EamA domain-containing protein n=1 Tax=Guillardia theta (strain CCMP2712) TaxID=905079 RepID=L1K2R1_GUITC|nr:hypothetical protein GUITHDRAFT_160735 [Guillardia theta CCMP2712]EKX54658.1 hypothetical protein GUITHDRAFT_160735 [Guillardia theta CCMP2712]|eukprot:XP_005841638.1 hypothetical protein GUITHDRAFT_160735 [Guillardia theta CCMP2712]